MNEFAELMRHAADVVADYRADVHEHPLGPPPDLDALRAGFEKGLQDKGVDPMTVLDELVAAAAPGLMPTAGPRYFGFVIGGSLDAAVAADVVAAGWDQCVFNNVLSPSGAAAEEVAGGWLKELLGIPATASVGFVTGGQAANTVGLAAARQHLLDSAGWEVAARGLAQSPPLRVVAGAERHATIDRTLRLLGIGTDAIRPVAVDRNGAMDAADLERVMTAEPDALTVVCAQAGNVNTGAFDDLRAIAAIARAHNAWLHVDGAFGLWAAASPSLRHLVNGVELADSWGCDGHKWLNVPYDSGYAFCAHPQVHATAVSYTASYLTGSGGGSSGADYTLESSRRARGFATWAAIRRLGRDGVAELVERSCRLARLFADSLAAGGARVGNEVVLNQVLVSFGDDDRTDRVIDGVQRDGTCWMGGTTWQGARYMRIAVSNATTTEDDVARSVDAILRIAAAL